MFPVRWPNVCDRLTHFQDPSSLDFQLPGLAAVSLAMWITQFCLGVEVEWCWKMCAALGEMLNFENFCS